MKAITVFALFAIVFIAVTGCDSDVTNPDVTAVIKSEAAATDYNVTEVAKSEDAGAENTDNPPLEEEEGPESSDTWGSIKVKFLEDAPDSVNQGDDECPVDPGDF